MPSLGAAILALLGLGVAEKARGQPLDRISLLLGENVCVLL